MRTKSKQLAAGALAAVVGATVSVALLVLDSDRDSGRKPAIVTHTNDSSLGSWRHLIGSRTAPGEQAIAEGAIPLRARPSLDVELVGEAVGRFDVVGVDYADVLSYRDCTSAGCGPEKQYTWVRVTAKAHATNTRAFRLNCLVSYVTEAR